jgi:hypothetical protein
LELSARGATGPLRAADTRCGSARHTPIGTDATPRTPDVLCKRCFTPAHIETAARENSYGQAFSVRVDSVLATITDLTETPDRKTYRAELAARYTTPAAPAARVHRTWAQIRDDFAAPARKTRPECRICGWPVPDGVCHRTDLHWTAASIAAEEAAKTARRAARAAA